MKTSTRASLIVFATLATFVAVPAFLIFYYHIFLLLVAVLSFMSCIGIVSYYLYVDIKENLDEYDSYIEGIKHDPEKMRFFKFFYNYFTK